MHKLPTKLEKEPLVDAIFEVRFAHAQNFSQIFPGFLYQSLKDKIKEFGQLPTIDIPQALRDSDPNLQYAPLHKLGLESFYINIGDRCVSVGCKYPYPGWSEFKPMIIRAMKILNDSGLIENIDRYSLKYVDLLPFPEIQTQINAINLDLTIGNNKLENNNFNIRMDVLTKDFIHIIKIVSSAVVNLNNATKNKSETIQGLIIDIDTIANQNETKIEDFYKKLTKKLEAIHTENKHAFFECLKPETIISLKPKYND